ncbi:MAG: lipase family protein [Chitinophagaceae bacterium]|nr:lipase family protein [Chitinophagaceae bacterium]
MKNLLLIFLLTSITTSSFTQQKLRPGFDSKEYLDLLSLAFYSSSIPDSADRTKLPENYKLQYRSPEVGLLNRWSLYLRPDNVATIDVRGTVNQTASWLANFYAAMIPATGSLQLNDSTTFNFQLSADPKAMVHVGWTLSLGHLAPEIVKWMNELYKTKQTKEFILFGHSQGAAINFLLRSYLHYEMLKGNLPKDLVIKTYCSAAPKPGNLYYAYDYENITRNNWGLTVVNTADWVPETPFSIQTVHDINPGNPIVNAKAALKNQKFFIRLAGKSVYNKLDRSTRKAQRQFEKYLGKKLYNLAIKKTLPQYKEPAYVDGNNYMRAGTPIILMPDEAYYQKFPTNEKKPFTHHLFAPYSMLAKRL